MLLFKTTIHRIGDWCKSVAVMSMCMVLIFAESYRVPVHAAAGIAPAIDTAVASALAALGISVSGNMSDSDYRTFLHDLESGAVNTAFQAVTATAQDGFALYHFPHAFLTSVGEAFQNWYDTRAKAVNLVSAFPNGNMSGRNLNINASQLYARLGFTASIAQGNLPVELGQIKDYNIVQMVNLSYSMSSFTAPNGATYRYASDVIYAGNDTLQFFTSNLDNSFYWHVFRNGKEENPSAAFKASSSALMGYVLDYVSVSSPGYERWALISSGITTNSYYFPLDYSLSSTAISGSLPDSGIGPDVINQLRDIFADGVSVLNNQLQDVIGRLDKLIGETDSTGAVSGDGVRVKDGADNTTEKLRDATGTQEKVIGQDATTDADKDKDKDTNKDKDTTAPKPASLPDLTLPQILTKKFPFCIPWDVYGAVAILLADPKAPYYQIVTNWPVIGKYTFTIDFSQFDLLARIIRWMLSVLWLLGLIILTPRLIKH